MEHASPLCTGNWRLQGAYDNRTIACDKCGVAHPATPDNRVKAIDENCAGIYLHRLATEGAAYLDGN